MGRPIRIQYPGAFYHIFNRGNRGEKIFREEIDYKKFRKYLFESVKEYEIRLYAWCLMPNHFHLLIETPKGNLSEFIHRLKTKYALYFNFVYKLKGHVFQERYKSILCRKEVYLLSLLRYIHLNPVKGFPEMIQARTMVSSVPTILQVIVFPK